MYSFRFLFDTTVDVFSILNPEGQFRLSSFETKLEKQGWDGLVRMRIRATNFFIFFFKWARLFFFFSRILTKVRIMTFSQNSEIKVRIKVRV